MRIRESAENYLETILYLKNKNGFVRSIDIANELEVTKPSVSIFMKNLRENGYIVVGDDGNIELTDTGLVIAEKIFERHTFLTELLIKLGVDEKVASEDACKIEHGLSEESFEAIKRFVNGF